MLAKQLQIASFASLIAAIAWFFYVEPSSPLLAALGVVVILFNFVPILGLQFLAARQLNKKEAARPLATRTQTLRAWWNEVISVPKIFIWHIAFRSNQIPDHLDEALGLRGRRGVVFVHGFVCNRGLWGPWLARLSKQKHVFVAVNLEPVLGSIDSYPAIIEEAVQKVTHATGLPPLIVCHSMGGLATRAWLRTSPGNDARVHHVVTIGTPHHGTWIGIDTVPTNMKQMKIGSDWLAQLARDEPPSRSKLFTCYYSNCDNIVFPTMNATLEGADNRAVHGDAHVVMVFNQRVMNESLAKL